MMTKRKTTKAMTATPARALDSKTADGFANFAARMGLNTDNLLSEGTYVFNLLTRNRIKLEAMYRGSWIVGQVVDTVAEDMVRAGISIHSEDDPKAIASIQVAMTRLGVWHALLNLTRWGRLYGGALALIDIDGQDVSTPMDVSTISTGQFRGLRIYDRWQLQPELMDMVEGGLHNGLPKYYTVVSDVNSGATPMLKIHYSRVIRSIGLQLPLWQSVTEMFWGESVVERMYDRLVAFDTATSGAANLLQKAHLRTVGIDKLREVMSAGGEAEENLMRMFHNMRMLQSNEGLTLLDKEDMFEAHSYTFSGLSDVILQFGQQIAGASGIPLVRLFGQSPAGLSATGDADMRMYYDNIQSQQESRLRDGIEKLLRVLHRSILGTDAPADLDFEFVPLWQTSTREKADIASVVVTTVNAAYESGVIDHETAMKELKQSSDGTGIFTNITDEQIAEAAAEEPPEVPVTPEAGDPENVAQPEQADAQPSAYDRIKAWIRG